MRNNGIYLIYMFSCFRDIGGSRAQPKKLQNDRVTESKWASFVSKDTTKVGYSGTLPNSIWPSGTKVHNVHLHSQIKKLLKHAAEF